jgi:hypothetical protein
VDGRLNEAAWERAEPASSFVQTAPRPGSPSSEGTEARVLYDDEALYVGLRMNDASPDSIAAQLGRRDLTRAYSDWAGFLVDSYHDRQTGYRFLVNPAGVKGDVLHFNDTGEDIGWDAVWDVAVRTDSAGWTAEFRIPFSQLRFSTPRGGAEMVWGINFYRDIARREERSWWSPVLPNSPGLVSMAGELRGLRGLSSPRHVELLPYTVARLTRAPDQPGNPFYNSNDLFGSAGADFKVGLTSGLTLTGTINPDFGQVEADPAQVNLSAFEVFLPERRPFFTEGGEVFRFGINPGGGTEQLFYSRRVGRAPQRTLAYPGGFVDAPATATILGAAKVTGKTRGWSLGILDAVTAGEEASVFVADARRREPVEPMTNYLAARASKDFRGGLSGLGGIFTATNRMLDDDVPLQFLRESAYAGGVDGRHRFGGGNYMATGWLLGSHIQGSTRAIQRAQRSAVRFFQRPDADHVEFDSTRTSLSGMAGAVTMSKIAGGHWRWDLLANFRSPGFEVNDAGFQSFADAAVLGANLRYDQSQPTARFRRWGVGFSPSTLWNFGGERSQLGGTVYSDFQLKNFWGGAVSLTRNLEGLSTTATRGGPALVRNPSSQGSVSFFTDRRRKVSAEMSSSLWVEDGTGGRTFSLAPLVRLRPSTRVDASLQPSVAFNHDDWQYVMPAALAGQPLYLFARLEQTTAALTARVSYTFTPELSLQLYAQPFVSAGSFSDFRQVDDARASGFGDRFRTYGRDEISYDPATRVYTARPGGAGTISIPNPDFNVRQLRTNTVLRWEYRPGSTMFVVWSQGRDVAGTTPFELTGDADALFAAPATNVLLVKFSYWLGL